MATGNRKVGRATDPETWLRMDPDGVVDVTDDQGDPLMRLLTLSLAVLVLLPGTPLAKVCRTGKPCGNTCISRYDTCHIGVTRSSYNNEPGGGGSRGRTKDSGGNSLLVGGLCTLGVAITIVALVISADSDNDEPIRYPNRLGTPHNPGRTGCRTLPEGRMRDNCGKRTAPFNPVPEVSLNIGPSSGAAGFTWSF